MKVCVLAVALAVLLQGVYSQEDPEAVEVEQDAPKVEEEQAPFEPPPANPTGDVYFSESFTDEEEVWKTWFPSNATKDGSDEPKYEGEWKLMSPSTDGSRIEDLGLVMPEAAKHYAVAAKMERTFDFNNAEAFVVQYEVNFQNGLSCGGAYVKLLTSGDNLNMFQDNTPYSIMFGPDKCGTSSKIHFIVQFKNPVSGEIEEKHSKQATDGMDFFGDKRTHLFTLLIRGDGVYHIIVDQVPFLKGNLLEDFTPAIVPLMEIDDPDDKMPENWDQREKIPDPEAVKPDDWDEDAQQKIEDPDAVKPDGWLDDGMEYVPDPDASMPEDWDEEEDGEYEPPMIPNPVCEEVGCGEWRPPMIQNPAYKGKWKPALIDNKDYDGKWAPRRIDNPAYFEIDDAFSTLSPVAAVGFELWTMSEGVLIDNIIICGELAVANNYANDGWVLKMQSEKAVGGGMSLGSWLDTFVELANTYPYLWALYAIAVVLPFVCCIGCCCIKSKPNDEAARRKKTDAPSPDDPQEEKPQDAKPQDAKDESFVAAADDAEEEEEEAKLSQGEGGSQGEEEPAGSQEEDGGSQEEEEEERAGSPQDQGGSQGEDEAEPVKTATESPPKKSSRKRKSRRED